MTKEKVEEDEEQVTKIIDEEAIKEIEKKKSIEEIREIQEEQRKEAAVASLVPRTKIGKLVKNNKIKDIDELLDKHKILEFELVDSLLNLKSDLLLVGQAKGKFGGGKRRAWRQTQRKTKEGNVPTFACMVVVGDGKGHVGLGYGKAKETLPARSKALRDAKLNIIKIKRGCGSFDCSCKEDHSIPFKASGKCGSTEVTLIPAPQGTGLVVGDECKKILRLAGIKDVYGRSSGQTRSTINLAKACILALKKITQIKEK